MTVASDWLRAKMMVVSSTRKLRPLMKIYAKEITSKKIIRLTHCHKRYRATKNIFINLTHEQHYELATGRIFKLSLINSQTNDFEGGLSVFGIISIKKILWMGGSP